MSPADRLKNTNPMKLSIVTVCHNSAQTIEATLLSVTAQTHNDIEYIVVDGASKDGTQEVVARHSGRVAKFVSESDRGIYDAMNKGLNLAKGDVIGFLNADDVYADDGVLDRVSAIMERKIAMLCLAMSSSQVKPEKANPCVATTQNVSVQSALLGAGCLRIQPFFETQCV